LNPIGAFCSKDVDRPAERISRQAFLYQSGEAIHAAPEVHGLCRYQYLHVAGWDDHDTALTSPTTAPILFGATPSTRRITTSPIVISPCALSVMGRAYASV